MTYVPVNRMRVRPLVALANLFLLLTMPLWGGLIVFASFAMIFIRREEGWRNLIVGDAFLLTGISEMFERSPFE